MMEDGKLNFYHRIIPFDQKVEDDIEQDPYYKNCPGNRFTEKSYKIKVFPKNLHIYPLKPIKDPDGKKIWIRFNFESEIIPKDTEFFLEISLSDKIDITDNESAIERRAKYFDSTISSSAHGVRYNKYQIETYNDKNGQPVKLPFEPWLYADGTPQVNKNNCNETIYYKTWKWDVFYIDDNPRSLLIKLEDTKRLEGNGAPCSKV